MSHRPENTNSIAWIPTGNDPGYSGGRCDARVCTALCQVCYFCQQALVAHDEGHTLECHCQWHYLQPGHSSQHPTQSPVAANPGDSIQPSSTLSPATGDFFNHSGTLVPTPTQEQPWAARPRTAPDGIHQEPAPHGREGQSGNPASPFICPKEDCSSPGPFTRKSSVRRHVNEQHGNINWLECDICGLSYKRNHRLVAHKRKTHG